MSHITQQSERDENKAIWDCPYRAVSVYVDQEDYWTSEIVQEWKEVNQCGDSEYISTAKDRCKRCGKIFTY